MTMEDFQNKLAILLGDAKDLPAGELAEELELQAQVLRDLSAADDE